MSMLKWPKGQWRNAIKCRASCGSVVLILGKYTPSRLRKVKECTGLTQLGPHLPGAAPFIWSWKKRSRNSSEDICNFLLRRIAQARRKPGSRSKIRKRQPLLALLMGDFLSDLTVFSQCLFMER